MNNRFLFGLLLFSLVATTVFNVYVAGTPSKDDMQAEIRSLEVEKQQALEEKNELKHTLKEEDPAEIQKQHKALEKDVSAFIETAFVQNKETYQDRKKNAKNIMSDELVNTFFPTDVYKGETETSVDDVEVFIKTGNLGSNHAQVIVRLEHTLHSLENDQSQVSPVFIEVNVQRQKDQWIITDFKEVREERNE
ncbi:hypothetical protein [Halobacillus sp. A5]|uniref:hypothetical protein n=1 Tax=Halobacillus sp. A5 TaxID=2880263 RepID=UPI0020A68010|nr:hypothetical protein [Halobacillus sp. A5]MCP3028777.1 hypothetical protein [Halobacillus sp. A5]